MQYDPYDLSNDTDSQKIYKHLRDNDPCHWDSKYKMWIISRYSDIKKYMKDSKTFSSKYGITLETRRNYHNNNFKRLFMEEDPPEHNRPRQIINLILNDSYLNYKDTSLFKDTFMKHYGPHIGSDNVEVIKNIFLPYAIDNLLTILSIPNQDYEKISSLSDAMFSSKTLDVQAKKMKEISILLFKNSNIIGEKYIGKVINNKPIDELDITMAYTAFMVAGFHTITNMLATIMFNIWKYPEEYRKIINNRLLINNFIEESLRLRVAGQYAIRTCTEEIVIHGKNLHPGDTVMFLTASAGSDENYIDGDPSEFSIDRKFEKHNFSFGYGPHTCPGANISRHELFCAIDTIISYTPNIKFNSFVKKDICDLSGSIHSEINLGFLKND
jgi:cytochrome P450